MLDKETVIRTFIKNFILKEKAERSFLELTNPKKRCKFTNRLNHNWDSVLNMKLFFQIDKPQDNVEDIQKLLGFKDQDICYVISNYNEVDGEFLPFKEVFDTIYSRGFATIVVNLTADTLFLDTEQQRGPADRFVGRFRN